MESKSYNRLLPPKTWLVESILVTLFCCMPAGIVGIINAAKVESAFHAGRIEEAEKASRNARKWTMIGFLIVVIAAAMIALGALIYSIIGKRDLFAEIQPIRIENVVAQTTVTE